jgi:hypothetical protein
MKKEEKNKIDFMISIIGIKMKVRISITAIISPMMVKIIIISLIII